MDTSLNVDGIADGMSGRRHRSNMELVAQGVANIGSPLFGGICVTGTIARTATNIRAGGVTPVAGMLHALFVLLFMLVAAPLASYIPLAALAGVLAVEEIRLRRRGQAEFSPFTETVLEVGSDRILRLANDLRKPEQGSLRVHLRVPATA